MVNLDEKALAKGFGLSRAKMGRWARPCREENAVELEKNSFAVARYVVNKINSLYRIEDTRKRFTLPKR